MPALKPATIGQKFLTDCGQNRPLTTEETIQLVINAVKQYGMEVFPQPTGEILVDMDDLVFYEVAMEKRDDDAYLVTGNQKHYPIKDFIVTPAEMMEIIDK